jgi:hypothetical protein
MPPSAFNLPPGSFGNYSGVDFNNPMYKFPDPGSVKFDPSVYTADLPAGSFGSFPSVDGSAADYSCVWCSYSMLLEVADYLGALCKALVTWPIWASKRLVINKELQQLKIILTSWQTCGMLNFGSDLFERNIGIADSFRIPDVVAGQRVNNPRYRQEMRMMNVPKLAGRLSGFLNT